MHLAFLFFSLILSIYQPLVASSGEEFALHKGRLRPLETYSKIFLYELYHSQEIQDQDLKNLPLKDGSAEEFLRALASKGPDPFVQAPLFYISSKQLQKNLQKKRISYEELKKILHTPLSEEERVSLLQKRQLFENPPKLYSKNLPRGLKPPAAWKIQLEKLYYSLPLITLSLLLYLGSLPLLLLPYRYAVFIGKGLFGVGFLTLTLTLIMRWLILNRPPVSNMAETMLYVPWIASLVALLWNKKTPLMLAAGAILSLIILTLLQISGLDTGLENVQPVLNSPFWLTIHVLMIVASYGVLLFAGVLGHLYLILKRKSPAGLEKLILNSLYLGVALLIPGTLLGGVWAAQSWGRFWDWDPKESWAFATACIYLLMIHAYRFHFIGSLGLAVGSIFGLIAVSFTWYGVNYILGSGLHSYGFGKGGEWIYYSFVAAELLFVCINILRFKQDVDIKS